jgi:ribosome-associated translation inhibitor RaiA
MEVSINGHGLGITDRFRDYATEKSEKVAHLADKALAFEIKVSRHNEKNGSSGDDRVELTLIGPGPLVVREKTHAATPITLEQALYEMELVGHDFYLFVDKESERPSVVYRRRGYDYGVISLDVDGS